MDCKKLKILDVNQNYWRDSLRKVISSMSNEQFHFAYFKNNLICSRINKNKRKK